MVPFSGCGNGKYLDVNPSVFEIGADRCKRLTEVAREKEHEVGCCLISKRKVFPFDFS